MSDNPDTEKIDSRIRDAIALAQATCPVASEVHGVLSEMRKENAERHEQQMTTLSAVREDVAKHGEQIKSNRKDISTNAEEIRHSRRTRSRNMWGIIAAGVMALVGIVLSLRG